jgi:hypothetical protein
MVPPHSGPRRIRPSPPLGTRSARRIARSRYPRPADSTRQTARQRDALTRGELLLRNYRAVLPVNTEHCVRASTGSQSSTSIMRRFSLTVRAPVIQSGALSLGCSDHRHPWLRSSSCSGTNFKVLSAPAPHNRPLSVQLARFLRTAEADGKTVPKRIRWLRLKAPGSLKARQRSRSPDGHGLSGWLPGAAFC